VLGRRSQLLFEVVELGDDGVDVLLGTLVVVGRPEVVDIDALDEPAVLLL